MEQTEKHSPQRQRIGILRFCRRHWMVLCAVAVGLLLLLDLYAELIGLPVQLNRYILGCVCRPAITVQAQRIHVGFFRGIRVISPVIILKGKERDVRCAVDSLELPLWQIFSAWKTFRLQNVRLTERDDFTGPLLAHANLLTVEYATQNEEHILSVKGAVQLVSRININASLLLKLIPVPGNKQRWNEVIDRVDDLRRLEKILTRISTQPENIELGVKLRYAQQRHKQASYQCHLSGEMKDILALGIDCRRIRFDSVLTNDEIEIRSMNIRVDEKEFISLSGTLPFPVGHGPSLFQGKVQMQIFPQRLLPLFYLVAQEGHEQELEKLKAILNLVTFHDTPPIFELRIRKFAPDFMQKGASIDISGELMLMDTNIASGSLQSGFAAFHVRDSKVTLTRCDAAIGQNTRLHCYGEFDRFRHTVYLETELFGAPTTLFPFFPGKEAQAILKKCFRNFRFPNYSNPHIRATIVHTGPPAQNWKIRGRALAHSFLFNDVPIDSLEGRFQIDLPNNLLLIPEIEVYNQGARARGRLAIGFARKDTFVQFQLRSNLPSQSLLRLFHPSLTDLLKDIGITFLETPAAYAHGKVMVFKPERNRFDVRVFSSKGRFHEIRLQDTLVALQFRGRRMSGDVTGERAEIPGRSPIVLQDFQIDNLNMAPGELISGRFQAGLIRLGEPVTAQHVRADFTVDKEKISAANVYTKKFEVSLPDRSRMQLKDVNLPVITIHSRTHDVNSSYVRARELLLLKPEQMNVQPIRVEQPVISQLRFFGAQNRLEINGSSGPLHFPAYHAASPASQFVFFWKAPEWELDLQLPQVTTRGNWNFQNVSVSNHPTAGGIVSLVTITSLSNESMNLENIKATLRTYGPTLQGDDVRVASFQLGPNIRGQQLTGEFSVVNNVVSFPAMMVSSCLPKRIFKMPGTLFILTFMVSKPTSCSIAIS